jgi:hypothetical protein
MASTYFPELMSIDFPFCFYSGRGQETAFQGFQSISYEEIKNRRALVGILVILWDTRRYA